MEKNCFGVPFVFLAEDISSDYMRSILLDNSTINSELFNHSYLINKIDNHISGKENNGFIL